MVKFSKKETNKTNKTKKDNNSCKSTTNFKKKNEKKNENKSNQKEIDKSSNDFEFSLVQTKADIFKIYDYLKIIRSKIEKDIETYNIQIEDLQFYYYNKMINTLTSEFNTMMICYQYIIFNKKYTELYADTKANKCNYSINNYTIQEYFKVLEQHIYTFSDINIYE